MANAEGEERRKPLLFFDRNFFSCPWRRSPLNVVLYRDGDHHRDDVDSSPVPEAAVCIRVAVVTGYNNNNEYVSSPRPKAAPTPLGPPTPYGQPTPRVARTPGLDSIRGSERCPVFFSLRMSRSIT